MNRQAIALSAALGALLASRAAFAAEPACDLELASLSPCAPAESCPAIELLLDQLAADLPPGDCALPDVVPGVSCEEPAKSPVPAAVMSLLCDGRGGPPLGRASRHLRVASLLAASLPRAPAPAPSPRDLWDAGAPAAPLAPSAAPTSPDPAALLEAVDPPPPPVRLAFAEAIAGREHPGYAPRLDRPPRA